MANYSIWVLEYAHVPNHVVGGLIYGAHNQGFRKVPYCYVLIKGQNHVAMVDVGYNHKEFGAHLADQYGATNWHPPATVLGECGVRPEDVDTVFITHAHFDHFGNVEDFPNATFYIQEREIAKWVWAMSLPERMQYLMVAVDPGDVLRGVGLAQKRRLVAVDGDKEDVLPGVDLHAAFDTHTFGSMWVSGRNDGKQPSDDCWVFGGDLVYVYENVEGDGTLVGVDKLYNPIGFAVGSQMNLILTTEQMMKTVHYEKRRLVPVHEERVKEEFPSRITKAGLRISEICLASGDRSLVE